jgi:hypothetical protein
MDGGGRVHSVGVRWGGDALAGKPHRKTWRRLRRGVCPGTFNDRGKLEISHGPLYVADQWNDRIEVSNLG